MYFAQQAVYQCCNLILARWFWATKVCLWESKMSKIRLFGSPNGRLNSWKANFENYSCIDNMVSILINIMLYNFNFIYMFYNFVSISLRLNIFLSSFSASISYDILFFFFQKISMGVLKGVLISVILCVFLLIFFYSILGRAPSLTFSFNFFF